MINKNLNILFVTKMLKKIKPLCIFPPKMGMYNKDFLIKDEKPFDKYNKIWEKVSNIIKKIIILKNIMKNNWSFKKALTQATAFTVFVKK